MKILIVDDDEVVQETLDIIMEPYGDRLAFDNGDDAVIAFKSALIDGDPFDLVFLDIVMPGGMDGQNVLGAMRALERARHVPPEKETAIIITSAVDAKAEVEKAYEQGGCTAYLTKPVSKVKILPQLADLGLIAKDWSTL